eukprot:466947_1
MCTIDSKDYTEGRITKCSLNTIHSQHLMTGLSNNKQKEAILSTLGGIDETLSTLLESNVYFSDKQLQSLHYIITHPNKVVKDQTTIINKTDNNIEDKGYYRKLKFIFNDNDILLYKIFTKQTAVIIINILNNKITKIGLALIILAWFASLIFAPDRFLFIYLSFMYLVFSIYFFGWILYCNKSVMNMLLKEFEFWLKTFYLSVWLLTVTIRTYAAGYPLVMSLLQVPFTGSILFLVMIFDAVNIKQSNKLIISSFVLGIFFFSALFFLQISLYRVEYPEYDKLFFTIKILNLFGLPGSMTFNIIDILINASRILAIFLLKQMVLSVIKPKQALVIRRRPFIIYENTKQHIPTVRILKNWKRVTVAISVISLLVFLSLLFLSKSNIIERVFFIMFIFAELIAICLVINGKIKYLWIENIIVFLMIMLYIVPILVLQWLPVFIVALFVQFGVSSAHTLMVYKFEELKHVSNNIISTNEFESMEKKHDDTYSENANVEVIELQNIHANRNKVLPEDSNDMSQDIAEDNDDESSYASSSDSEIP